MEEFLQTMCFSVWQDFLPNHTKGVNLSNPINLALKIFLNLICCCFRKKDGINPVLLGWFGFSELAGRRCLYTMLILLFWQEFSDSPEN